MKLKLIIILLFLITQQAYTQGKMERMEMIYKEKELYYMFIEPSQKNDRWYKLFIQFDVNDVLNTGHANSISSTTVESGRIWQILNDTLFFLTVTETGGPNRLRLTAYNQYPLDTVFKIVSSDDRVMNMHRKFATSIPSHTYQYQADRFNWLVKLHIWSDIVHTKDEFTIFASVSDTILMIKDIPLTYSRENRDYTTREHTYTFPYLGKFNVFKIKDGYYVINDIGDFYLLQDSVPKKIGSLEYTKEKQLFYLKDNDTDRLSFNCRFVPLYPEYNDLVGYIDPQHWLYKKYFEIKKKYVKELHELNRKTWK